MTGPLTRLLRARTARLVSTADAMRTAFTHVATMGNLSTRTRAPELVSRVLGKVAPGKAAARPQNAPPADGAAFTRHTYTGEAGTRPYRLFVPAGLPPPPAASGPAVSGPALVVMLHGCTQSAEDFAAGTRMNLLAAQAGVLVLYPVQVAGANAQRCWNWFNPADQQRDGGEAALIAGMTRSVMADTPVSRRSRRRIRTTV